MKTAQRQYEPRKALALMRQGAEPLLARLWASRGVETYSEVFKSVENLLPYTSLLNCVEAAERLAEAIRMQERIVVIADFDADGATACAVMVRALRAFGANVGHIIPHRIEHEYGLTPAIVAVAAGQAERPKIILTVDNGITSFAGIDLANELGMEVVVTDHHLESEKGLPAASLIVNPNQNACTFASKALPGCGVAYYVMWALQAVLEARDVTFADPKFSIETLLPIVAIGTIADVVPLDVNNRSIITEGMRLIHEGRAFPGIDALARTVGRDPRSISTTDIAFGVAPQINAAGRLQSMNAGVDCLITDDVDRARALAAQLFEINSQRKEIESDTVDEASLQMYAKIDPSSYSIVLHNNQWHPGVIGIVAGRFKEKFYRPTFILTNGNEGEVKGSGRSIPGFHLRDALDLVDKRLPGVLLKYGGHAMAAGVTIRGDKVQEFRDAFEAVARQLLTPAMLNQELMTDGGLTAQEMSLATVRLLKQQVWGQMFPEPLFLDEFQVEDARPIGGGKHLKLTLTKDGRRYGGVRFRYTGDLPAGKIRVAYKLDANTFNNETSLQLMVEYFEPVQVQPAANAAYGGAISKMNRGFARGLQQRVSNGR